MAMSNCKNIPKLQGPVKDNLSLRTSDMYCIPCKCGEVYVGHTFRTIEIICQKHIGHSQSQKSAVAEHIKNTRQVIKLEKRPKIE
jgi:hypothetical protein